MLSDFRIFETDQFRGDLRNIFGAGEEKIVTKLRRYVNPQLRQQPYFGKNIRKLKGYAPETWRYRIRDYRFFYEIDDKKRIVFMIAAGLRAKGY